jgi:hypothetical protein
VQHEEVEKSPTVPIQGSEVAPQASSDETPRKSPWERFVEFKEQSAGKHWNPLINIMRKHHRFDVKCNRVYILNQLTLIDKIKSLPIEIISVKAANDIKKKVDEKFILFVEIFILFSYKFNN